MAGRRKLILINGQPGVGKTTLKKRLSVDLGIPAIGKDDIKEFLFDIFEVDDTKWPGLLGRVSSTMLTVAAQTFLEADQPIIVETAFMYQFAYADWSAAVAATEADMLEIYCQLDADVRRRRFDERIASGQRHSGHIDATNNFSDDELAKRYAPLHIGKTIFCDTTTFDEKLYTDLLVQVQTYLKGEKDA